MCVEKDKNPIWEDVANKNDFVYQGRHLPYNRELKERARVLRKQMTNCERILWYEFLCDIKPNFLRQRPIDRYIVDFYCPEKQLVVEIDGESHYTDEAKIYDARRTFILENPRIDFDSTHQT